MSLENYSSSIQMIQVGGKGGELFLFEFHSQLTENLLHVSSQQASSYCSVIACYRVISCYWAQSLMRYNCCPSHPNHFSNSKPCWMLHRKGEKPLNHRCASEHYYRNLNGPIGKFCTSLKFHCKSQTVQFLCLGKWSLQVNIGEDSRQH